MDRGFEKNAKIRACQKTSQNYDFIIDRRRVRVLGGKYHLL